MVKILLVGKNISLKQMSYIDADDFFLNIKNPALNKYSGPYYATSIPRAKEYIKKCNKNILNKKSFCLGIYLNTTKKLIGSLGLININPINNCCELGFWLGKDYWNRGLMTESINLIVNYAFKKLSFHRIFAYIHQKNIASIKVLKKADFKLEGILKESTKKNNKYYDEYIFAKVN